MNILYSPRDISRCNAQFEIRSVGGSPNSGLKSQEISLPRPLSTRSVFLPERKKRNDKEEEGKKKQERKRKKKWRTAGRGNIPVYEDKSCRRSGIVYRADEFNKNQFYRRRSLSLARKGIRTLADSLSLSLSFEYVANLISEAPRDSLAAEPGGLF